MSSSVHKRVIVKQSLLSTPLPRGFRFQPVLLSHGWVELAPTLCIPESRTLSSVISISHDRHASVSVLPQRGKLSITARHTGTLSRPEKESLISTVRSMCRMDEQLTEFYHICRAQPHLRWIHRIGGGRMLRGATVFEDVMKMICTTNCSWGLTKIMVNNLVTKLGVEVLPGRFSFPSASVIAAKSERWLRTHISCGYRAPYLKELSESIASGERELESMRHSTASTAELYDQLRSIKGVGHYAAGNLLKLLGRYDYLGIDSWVRKRFSRLHRNGRKVSDAVIERHYHRYGKWGGLVCWMEMTQEWYENSV